MNLILLIKRSGSQSGRYRPLGGGEKL